jgi:hypothetical protein
VGKTEAPDQLFFGGTMKTLAALLLTSVFAVGGPGVATGQAQPTAPNLVSGESYFTIHNIRLAHQITLGTGARVGIVDHSFARETHPELYAGGERFLEGSRIHSDRNQTHHGYWMALTLNQIAPGAEIFALEIPTGEEASRVHATAESLDWAVEHGLDAVTYCGRGFSEEARRVLDPVVERTVEAGVVVVFLDYTHPMNLLPGGFEAPSAEGTRDPDLNIFSYDCTVLFANQFLALMESDDNGIQRYKPFLAQPATGSVTAGLVALLRSVDPDASPAEIKRVLVETSRPMAYRGRKAARVPDAFEAVTRVKSVSANGKGRYGGQEGHCEVGRTLRR